MDRLEIRQIALHRLRPGEFALVDEDPAECGGKGFCARCDGVDGVAVWGQPFFYICESIAMQEDDFAFMENPAGDRGGSEGAPDLGYGLFDVFETAFVQLHLWKEWGSVLCGFLGKFSHFAAADASTKDG